MATIVIPPASILNLQQLEAYVSGPDTANRLLTISGQFTQQVTVNGLANSSVENSDSFSVLVGPVLTHNQFFKAIATGSLAQISYYSSAVPSNSFWSIDSIDADWDDESGQVELRIDVSIEAFGPGSTSVVGLNFQVTILYMAAAQ